MSVNYVSTYIYPAILLVKNLLVVYDYCWPCSQQNGIKLSNYSMKGLVHNTLPSYTSHVALHRII